MKSMSLRAGKLTPPLPMSAARITDEPASSPFSAALMNSSHPRSREKPEPPYSAKMGSSTFRILESLSLSEIKSAKYLFMTIPPIQIKTERETEQNQFIRQRFLYAFNTRAYSFSGRGRFSISTASFFMRFLIPRKAPSGPFPR